MQKNLYRNYDTSIYVATTVWFQLGMSVSEVQEIKIDILRTKTF